MGIFKKDPIERLDENELRDKYLEAKRMEKITAVFYMVVFGLVTIATASYSIAKEIYWVLSFSIISIIAFIHFITSFSRILEDIFENRILEEEPHG